MAELGYDVLSHTADLGLEVWGPTLEAVFGLAAEAMFEVMGEPTSSEEAVSIEIEATGIDREDLLVALLTELLVAFELDGEYLSDAQEVVLTEVQGEEELRGRIRGRGVQIVREHERGLAEIKAVTYHELCVEETTTGWFARVIFDL